MEESKSEQKPQYGMSVAIGFIAWSICFLALSYRPMPGWLSSGFFVLGFVLLLIGVMGFCIEKFKQVK